MQKNLFGAIADKMHSWNKLFSKTLMLIVCLASEISTSSHHRAYSISEEF
jgi:hypothetical protein